MPAIVRKNADKHVGHASPTPNPFHQTAYTEGSSNVFVNGESAVRIGDKTGCTDPATGGSPNVFVNGESAVRIGDKTGCTDPATGGSPNVFINNIAVHRKGDSTGGHESWVPNAAATGSDNVFAND